MGICTFPVKAQNLQRRVVNGFWKRFFYATVYMEFRVCFSFAKYEKDTLSLGETTNVFIDAYKLFRNPFSSVRTV